MSPPVAAVDCGTNSTRLLIAESGRDGHLVALERIMRITRLGQGVDATGRLDPAAIDRTVAVLEDYRGVLDHFGVERVRMTATSAARDASNSKEFFDLAQRAIGARPELITGDEEGRLAFTGATSELDRSRGPFLVVDIGGGSTEFSYGLTGCDSSFSVDVGCVRMTEKYLLHDPPLAEELYSCLSVVRTHLDDVEREVPGVAEGPTLIGLAGTVSAAAAIEIGLPEYDRDRIHHFVLTKAAVEDVFRTLATESVDDRVDNPGLEPERADVIVGGLCILVAVMRKWGFAECLVSEADMLDGLAMTIA